MDEQTDVRHDTHPYVFILLPFFKGFIIKYIIEIQAAAMEVL
jgi:hypothetical protein